jgi:nucleotide-binding universal stress UspA family protein/GNAT superfamily N-acetyltransferase
MRHDRIVVGIDDDTTNDELALAWAVQEAASKGLALHVIHPFPAPAPQLPPPVYGREIHAVSRALARVRELNDQVEATGDAVEGSPVSPLVELSRYADTIVLGAHRSGVLDAVLLGSVSAAVAARAHCPTVVVRAADPDVATASGNSPTGPASVVVGVDGDQADQSLLAYAFDFASRHGSDLRAVLCWHLSPVTTHRTVVAFPERAAAWLWLAGWRAGGLAGWRAGGLAGKILGRRGAGGRVLRSPGRGVGHHVARSAAAGRGQPRQTRPGRDPARIGQPRCPASRPVPGRRHPPCSLTAPLSSDRGELDEQEGMSMPWPSSRVDQSQQGITSPGEVVLGQDGRHVELRALRADDETALHALHEKASDRSRYLRFFTLSHASGNQYVETLLHPDSPDDAAIVALLDGALVGVAAFARVDETSAEIAMLVADAAQHHGIGTLLIEQLIDIARSRGLTHFVADVLLENATMLRVLTDLHYRLRTTNEGCSDHVIIDLTDTPAVRAAHDQRVCIAAAAARDRER